MNRTQRTARFFALVVSASLLAAIPASAESIPPNCTMNPFTHKMTCHVLPKPKKVQVEVRVRAAD